MVLTTGAGHTTAGDESVSSRDDGISGRVALVTGAAGGIGAAVVEALAVRGARVVAADVELSRLYEEAERLSAAGWSVSPSKLDVTDGPQVEAVVAQIEEEIAPVELLANVAGVLRTAPLADMRDQDWAQVFAVNTLGVFHVSRAVARRMRERRSGAIVTVGSNAASVPRMGMGAYCASKAASSSLTKCLGLELAGYGIRCNVVAPGSTDTPMLRSMWTDDYGPASAIEGDGAHYRVGIPLGKLAGPRDIAEAVAFLVSTRAGHITMQELCVDGGAALGR